MNCYPIINQVPALPLDRPLPLRVRAPLWPEMAFAAQTNVPAFYCLYNTAKNKRKKISQLWHFSHRRQTRNISMRKSPKIVSIVGFLLSLPSLSATLLPSLSLCVSVNPSVISFQLGRQFSKNEAHTTEPKGTQRRTSSIRRRSPKEADEEESTTPAMGKWQHWCFRNMCKQLPSIGSRRGKGKPRSGRLQICLALLTRLFRAVCVCVLVTFRQLE